MKNLLLIAVIFITSSCVNNSLQPDVVSRSDAQKQQYVVFGTIMDVSIVTIEVIEKLVLLLEQLLGQLLAKYNRFRTRI